MPAAVAPEVSGGVDRLVRLPHTAATRQAVTYLKLVRRVYRDRAWGGWAFDGPVHRPGAVVPLAELPPAGLALECAGVEGHRRGHDRNPTLYILWRYDPDPGEWRKLAESRSLNRGWTLELGAIAADELDPPRPFLVDPRAAAGRVIAALARELEPLEFRARVLVVRQVQDHLAAGEAR